MTDSHLDPRIIQNLEDWLRLTSEDSDHVQECRYCHEWLSACVRLARQTAGHGTIEVPPCQEE